MSIMHVPHSAATRSAGKAFLLSALAAIFWGTNFEATHIALQGLPPWTASALRFTLASLAILLWLRFREGFGLAALRQNFGAYVILGIVGVAGFNAALFVGMQTSSPVTAALIMGTTPLTTNLLDGIIRRQTPSTRSMIGLIVSLLGVALTVGAFSGAQVARGDLLILIGSLAWAVYTIGCRRWVIDATPLATSAWTILVGALVLILVAFLFETPFHAGSRAPLIAWAAILWMAFLGSVLAYIFWQIGVATRGPAATSILFNLVPVAALTVATVLGQPPQISQILGVGIAIFGIVWASGHLTPAVRR